MRPPVENQVPSSAVEEPASVPGVHEVKARARSSSTKLVIVRNLRSTTSPQFSRLVLDLTRPVEFVERRESGGALILIEVDRAILGKSARARLTGGKIPRYFTITQVGSSRVTITLQDRHIKSYKVFTLSSPDRLVMDIFHRPPNEVQQIVGTAETESRPRSTRAPASEVGSTPTTVTPRAQDDTHTIVIDPGHGGKDPGTVGRRGTREKDITLAVSLLLREKLRKLPNVRVLMTRERDTFIELEERAKFANSKGADLFVSIHVNSHPQRSVSGLEVYHFGEAKDQRALEVAARENGTPLNNTAVGWEYLVADLLTSKKIEDSLELAWTTKEAMMTQLNGTYKTVDHGVKTAPFYVLRYTSMPSVLTEIAFMSNPGEERLMRTPTYLKRIADAIFDAIKTFVSPARTASR